jgi:oligosaccharide repeat unit polymerase
MRIFRDDILLKFGLATILKLSVLTATVAVIAIYASRVRTPLAAWFLMFMLFVCAVTNYLYSRDVIYPGSLFCTIWAFAVSGYVFFPFDINAIGWTTVFIIAGGASSFSTGCFFGDRPLLKGPAQFRSDPRTRQIARLLLIYSLFTVPLVVYATMRIAGTSSVGPGLFIAARTTVLQAQSEGQSAYNSAILDSAAAVSVSVAFILLLDERKRWIRALGIVAASLVGLFSTGRVVLLLLASGWVLLVMLRKSDRSLTANLRPILIIVSVLLLVLTSVTLLTKTETQQGSGIAVAIRLTGTYIAGPIAALDYAVGHPTLFTGSNNTFAQLLKPLSALGFHFTAPPTFDPFLPIPFPFNVFTAYKNYYIDFGVAGCLLAFFIFGFITGVLFHAAKNGNRLAAFASTYLFYALSISPFNDAYHLFSRYAFVTLFGVSYFVLSRTLPNIRISPSNNVGSPRTAE